MKILIAFVLLIAGIAGCIIADANIIKAAFALLICGAGQYLFTSDTPIFNSDLPPKWYIANNQGLNLRLIYKKLSII